ncbi:MAG TPA: cell division protein FtsK, partial [Rhodospirillaceae bacterium]|nr:cell division protein FtsK [Rhodospirillaceae bacterium]
MTDFRALFIGGLGGFLLLALSSYHSTDPSLNTSGSGAKLQNWMGQSGATLSDILIQIFGIGSFVFAFSFIVWGLRLWRRENFGSLWMRSLAILSSALLLGVAGGAIPGGSWSTHASLGGAGGTLALNTMTGWIGSVIGFYPHIIIAIISAIAGIVLAGIGIALKQKEREAVLVTFLSGGAATISGASSIWDRISSTFSRPKEEYADEEYEDNDSDEEEYAEEDEEIDEEQEDESDAPPERIAVVNPNKTATKSAAKEKSKQVKLNLRNQNDWEYPSLDFLQEVPPQVKEEKLDESALRKNAELLQNVLNDYNVKGEIKSIHPGPVVTLYELEPAPGTKTSRVVSLSDDIARSMSAVS